MGAWYLSIVINRWTGSSKRGRVRRGQSTGSWGKDFHSKSSLDPTYSPLVLPPVHLTTPWPVAVKCLIIIKKQNNTKHFLDVALPYINGAVAVF